MAPALRPLSGPVVAALAAALLAVVAQAEPPSVSIDAPRDGATVQSPVRVEMSAEDLAVEPAGTVRPGAGHFHLLIDLPCDAAGSTAPAGPQRLRLADGRRQVDVPLAPGDHTLCLQAADGRHAALAATDEIKVHVVAGPSRGKPATVDEIETPPGGERWEGTLQGEVKSGRDCAAATNVGRLVVVVEPRGEAWGGGYVTCSAFTCRTPQGSTTIPEQTSWYGLQGAKEAGRLRLTFSSGHLTMRLVIDGDRARGNLDQSAGDYIARSAIELRRVSR